MEVKKYLKQISKETEIKYSKLLKIDFDKIKNINCPINKKLYIEKNNYDIQKIKNISDHKKINVIIDLIDFILNEAFEYSTYSFNENLNNYLDKIK